jgi:hypothetical protein
MNRNEGFIQREDIPKVEGKVSPEEENNALTRELLKGIDVLEELQEYLLNWYDKENGRERVEVGIDRALSHFTTARDALQDKRMV